MESNGKVKQVKESKHAREREREREKKREEHYVGSGFCYYSHVFLSLKRRTYANNPQEKGNQWVDQYFFMVFTRVKSSNNLEEWHKENK